MAFEKEDFHRCVGNGWQWLDGNSGGVAECFYFGSDGYVLINTVTPDGYQVYENGAWIENGTIKTKTVTATSNTPNDKYNEYGSNHVAIDLFNHTREENAVKYIEEAMTYGGSISYEKTKSKAYYGNSNSGYPVKVSLLADYDEK